MAVLRGWAVADETQSDYDDDFDQTGPLETVSIKEESDDNDDEGTEQIEPLDSEPVLEVEESEGGAEESEGGAEESEGGAEESEGGVKEFEETETVEEQETPLLDQFMDAIPLSTASSLLVIDRDVNVVAEAEQTETHEALSVETDEKESLEIEESEREVEKIEGTENDDEEFEGETPSSDRFMDVPLVSAASLQLVKDEDADIETESDEEGEKETETNYFENREPEETVDAAEKKESDSRESIFSKLWWTKVRTETEDVPELEEALYGEPAEEISVSVVYGEKENDEQDDTFENVESSVVEKAEDVELEFEERATDEVATMRPLETEARTEAIPDVEVDSIPADRLEPGLQTSLEEESTKVLMSDTVVDVESSDEEESPYTSSGYVCPNELSFIIALLFLDSYVACISLIAVGYY
jgi:hypothetical protein